MIGMWAVGGRSESLPVCLGVFMIGAGLLGLQVWLFRP